ncbi:MAG: RagB/SusD family nutrient uptake outer membrane protein [Candidatus Pseudobacter hemicellulosilyticus]|uniref:RagB/SusD family nutrient uptake outer membrane protein n=1 Tax=Candidatus Pseudobacter hemicellulosilyticus TaxID=3121375 RepID=A0AAJ6BHA4_9BACT|nr:MAG: RagB/SusD family nutrient uptake outer membrane protein [Pseudobacter sp.]
MNFRYSLAFLFGALFLLGSCNKYLDVQPEAAYTEVQVYSNEAALQQAFNGLYIDLSSRSLYGANLSTTLVELLAQRYKPMNDGGYGLSVFNRYTYSSQVAINHLDTLWRKSYSLILATNLFLSRIDNSISGRVISETNGQLLKGEALAIRAMMHFDLLRLFGPVYATGSAQPAIPYYTVADGKMQPVLPATEVMDKVMTDLREAVSLLANDPVISQGIVAGTDFYGSARNQRLNYFAVKALMARAFLWSGNKQAAHDAALSVLTEGEKWFPWVSTEAVTTGTNPDRIFAPEILFSIYNQQLYNQYDQYFNPSLLDGYILVPDPLRLTEVYEGFQQDYRFVQTWLIGGGKTYRSSYKYAPIAASASWRFLQPLLRKSELYFILAETDPDPAAGLDYLNTARRRRGLANLGSTVSLSAELRKEYQKEFWGEGQLFFFYKRINANNVPDAGLPYVWATVAPTYMVPLPLSETSTR